MIVIVFNIIVLKRQPECGTLSQYITSAAYRMQYLLLLLLLLLLPRLQEQQEHIIRIIIIIISNNACFSQFQSFNRSGTSTSTFTSSVLLCTITITYYYITMYYYYYYYYYYMYLWLLWQFILITCFKNLKKEIKISTQQSRLVIRYTLYYVYTKYYKNHNLL